MVLEGDTRTGRRDFEETVPFQMTSHASYSLRG